MGDLYDRTALIESEEVVKPFLQAAKELVASDGGGGVASMRMFVLKLCSSSPIFCGYDDIKQILHSSLHTTTTQATVAVGTTTTVTEGQKILNTLDLFSYGTYQDYTTTNSSAYLALTESALVKLRQLTVLSLVQRSCYQVPLPLPGSSTGAASTGAAAAGTSLTGGTGIIPYDVIAEELGFSTATATATGDPPGTLIWRQVEEILLSCMYCGVLQGQLCQKSKTFILSSRHGPPCRSRDVNTTTTTTTTSHLDKSTNDIDIMLQTFQLFQQRIHNTYAEQSRIQKSVTQKIVDRQNSVDTIMEQTKKALASAKISNNYPNSSGGYPHNNANDNLHSLLHAQQQQHEQQQFEFNRIVADNNQNTHPSSSSSSSVSSPNSNNNSNNNNNNNNGRHSSKRSREQQPMGTIF